MDPLDLPVNAVIRDLVDLKASKDCKDLKVTMEKQVNVGMLVLEVKWVFKVILDLKDLLVREVNQVPQASLEILVMRVKLVKLEHLDFKVKLAK